MAEVVSLTGEPLPTGEPDVPMMNLARGFLEAVESGTFVAISVVMVRQDGAVITDFEALPYQDVLLLGAMRIAQMRYEAGRFLMQGAPRPVPEGPAAV